MTTNNNGRANNKKTINGRQWSISNNKQIPTRNIAWAAFSISLRLNFYIKLILIIVFFFRISGFSRLINYHVLQLLALRLLCFWDFYVLDFRSRYSRTCHTLSNSVPALRSTTFDNVRVVGSVISVETSEAVFNAKALLGDMDVCKYNGFYVNALLELLPTGLHYWLLMVQIFMTYWLYTWQALKLLLQLTSLAINCLLNLSHKRAIYYLHYISLCGKLCLFGTKTNQNF